MWAPSIKACTRRETRCHPTQLTTTTAPHRPRTAPASWQSCSAPKAATIMALRATTASRGDFTSTQCISPARTISRWSHPWTVTVPFWVWCPKAAAKSSKRETFRAWCPSSNHGWPSHRGQPATWPLLSVPMTREPQSARPTCASPWTLRRSTTHPQRSRTILRLPRCRCRTTPRILLLACTTKVWACSQALRGWCSRRPRLRWSSSSPSRKGDDAHGRGSAQPRTSAASPAAEKPIPKAPTWRHISARTPVSFSARTIEPSCAITHEYASRSRLSLALCNNPFTSLCSQVRSPTTAAGKAAGGSSHARTNSRVITASTPDTGPSSATCARGHSPGLTTSHFTWRDTCEGAPSTELWIPGLLVCRGRFSLWLNWCIFFYLKLFITWPKLFLYITFDYFKVLSSKDVAGTTLVLLKL